MYITYYVYYFITLCFYINTVVVLVVVTYFTLYYTALCYVCYAFYIKTTSRYF